MVARAKVLLRRAFLLPLLAVVYCLGLRSAFVATDPCQLSQLRTERSRSLGMPHDSMVETPTRRSRPTSSTGLAAPLVVQPRSSRTALKAGAETGFDLSGKAGATVVGTATSDSGAEARSWWCPTSH
eukprot:Skav208325  [mRNA]  locus=scaffold897:772119:778908:+ [translate_table: standard]